MDISGKRYEGSGGWLDVPIPGGGLVDDVPTCRHGGTV